MISYEPYSRLYNDLTYQLTSTTTITTDSTASEDTVIGTVISDIGSGGSIVIPEGTRFSPGESNQVAMKVCKTELVPRGRALWPQAGLAEEWRD